MKLSVCIDSICRGWDLTEALELVKKSGIGAFEFWNWKNKDLDRMEREMDRLGLTLSAFCTVGGALANRDSHGEYLEGLRDAVAVAKRLGCKRLITTAGNESEDMPRAKQLEDVASGLRSAAGIVEEAGITLLLEPLNTAVDHPGQLLSRSSEAFDIIDQVGNRYVKVLFDAYHQQVTEGNLISAMTEHIASIGHIHAAGCPGRHELQFGEIHYGNLISALSEAGYQHYFGLEYVPTLHALEGLKSAKKLFETGIDECARAK
ncbi:TIM barrel protein [Paenibacillus sp. HB172176]|uniref:hydroxypyruvate isomerase family protein n=1 Tax=Paenibacillus sp. HB172176 TaxID=2493690 RepID=UPI00143C807F|nr:TIM barrel protein [Paenibacillus sp. HB172176]